MAQSLDYIGMRGKRQHIAWAAPSIREEITHVKQQLDEQVRSGKVADETRMLISTLLMIVDMLIAIFLEKNKKKATRIPVFRPRKQTRIPVRSLANSKTSEMSTKSHLPTVAL
jgi:hypothetical protein